MQIKKIVFSLLVVLVCSSIWAQNAPRQIRNNDDSRQLDREQSEFRRQMKERWEQDQREAAAKKEEKQRQATVKTTGCNPRIRNCDPAPAKRSVRQAPAQQPPAPAYDPNPTSSDQIKFRRTN